MRSFAGVFSQQPAGGGLQEYSIWASSILGTIDNDGEAYSYLALGTKFRTSTNGEIRAIRYQKPSGSTIVSVALFQGTTNVSGTQAVGSQGTNGTWVRQDFSSPVSITSGTIYTAVVYYNKSTSNSYYATAAYFNSARFNGPIEAVATSVSANGCYAYSNNSTLINPSNSGNGTSYYSDIVFAA